MEMCSFLHGYIWGGISGIFASFFSMWWIDKRLKKRGFK